MVPRRVQRPHPRWTLRPDPHAGRTMALHPACVAFGSRAPTLQVPRVGGTSSRLAPSKPPWLKAAPPLGAMRVDGVRAGRPRLVPGDEPRRPLISRGPGARAQRVSHRWQGLWASRPTCSTTSGATSSPRSIQPARCFNRASSAPLLGLAGCAPARRGRPVRPHASVYRAGAGDRPGSREASPALPPNPPARPLPPRPPRARPQACPDPAPPGPYA